MAHTNSIDKTNKTKSNTYNNQPQNANTESYSNFMDNMEYYSVLGFLLTVFAYELAHEQQMSD